MHNIIGLPCLKWIKTSKFKILFLQEMLSLCFCFQEGLTCWNIKVSEILLDHGSGPSYCWVCNVCMAPIVLWLLWWIRARILPLNTYIGELWWIERCETSCVNGYMFGAVCTQLYFYKNPERSTPIQISDEIAPKPGRLKLQLRQKPG